MKVGLVCPYDLARHGGVQNQVLELARRLPEHGDEVTLIGPGAGAHGGVELGEAVGVKANRSVAPIVLRPRVMALVTEAVAGVDLVHLHEPLMPLVGWGAMGLDRPMVATFHADPPAWVDTFYRLVPRRWWRGKVLTAVSPLAARSVERWGEVTIVPNGIDAGAFRDGPQRSRHQVAFLGRPDRRKGWAVLEQAWPKVTASITGAELVVMGMDGSSTSSMRFLGRVSEETKISTLQSSEVFVAPNLGGESFGIILLEAMAAGCAIVASDLEAFRLVSGGTARIVPVGDSPHLAATLVELLRSPKVTSEMGRRSRARAADFDWSIVVAGYRASYQRAVESG